MGKIIFSFILILLNVIEFQTTNHLGQLIMADNEGPSEVKIQSAGSYSPRTRQLSNHRNFYQVAEDQA